MKVKLIQYSPAWENKNENMEKILRLGAQMSSPSDLIIFPEMSLTGFSMNASVISEPIEGESVKFFSNLARSFNSNVIFGMPLIEPDGYYNALICLDRSGNIKDLYKKIHLFSYAKENLTYKSGGKPVLIALDGFRIGLSICYDLRFPELFRKYTRSGLDVIINIANWPESRIEHWNALLKARAIENLSYILAVNRTGKDPFVSYNGNSSVINPLGEMISFSHAADTILEAELRKDCLTETRSRFPFIQDIKLTAI